MLTIQGFSQSDKTGIISGSITDDDRSPIKFCSIYIEASKASTQSDKNGKFKFESLPFGNHTLQFYLLGYEKKSETIELKKTNEKFKFKLVQKAEQLSTVVVKSKEDAVGEMQRMRSVEGLLISEGKKNEVIDVSRIDANLAINQGRQIYAKVPGLNIWEGGGSGLQLGIGGRGLNPSRSSNFNTRQNGYDISADALGYPESYYTPPAAAIKKIQLIRGAAAMQFGTQFGGLLNFVLKDGPKDKKVEVTNRNTIGSFGLYSSFTSVGFNKGKWKGYAYIQYRRGNEWRPNSGYNFYSGAINLKRTLSDKAYIRVEFTKQYYLAQQSGGLTDEEFYTTPEISKRERNWFEVDWNLAAISYDYKFSSKTKLKTQFFGLLAKRNALGVLGNITRPDNPYENRQLISGQFKNWGNETKLLHQYKVKENLWTFLTGVRYYQGYNLSTQGLADTTNKANFSYIEEAKSRYEFPSNNIAVFTEHIFRLGKKLSITPGVRFEYINTNVDGSYYEAVENNAGTVFDDTTYTDKRNNSRTLLLGGIGIGYKLNKHLNFYTNISQNYRSINFTDMQIQNSNFKIDPDLEDESGYNFDFGGRGSVSNKIYYDASVFVLSYNNRIGEIDQVDEQTFIPYRYRTNISKALIKGVEAVVEADWWKILVNDTSEYSLRTYVNVSYTDAKYTQSDKPAFEGKYVESVPPFNLKTGLTYSFSKFSITYQYSFVQEHYSDATNAGKDADGNLTYIYGAVVGVIPSYNIMDLSLKYKFKNFQLESGIQNLTNEVYFTRRATGYPGPGIIPSPSRNYYLSLQVKF
ncbi:MAG: TonB-dependent receptor [Flavobacteriales bacterium]|nr:TonB-dependent receptor [Flavobacteriales bacterium]